MSSKSKFNTGKSRINIRGLQQLFQNLQMAVRLMQMGLQKTGETTVKLDKDMGQAMGMLNDLQYRTLAMMELLNVDKDKLDEIAERMKTEDFDKASAAEDLKKGFVNVEVVDAECDVILTSFCKDDETKSIFRSRITLGDITDGSLREKFLGLKVGDVTTMKLMDKEHAVEILGIRKAAPKVETTTEVVPVETKETVQPEVQ
jgi:hypothetical protein